MLAMPCFMDDVDASFNGECSTHTHTHTHTPGSLLLDDFAFAFCHPLALTGFIFLHHPALGPLWDVIAQKIRGGALLQGSELILEVAEARLLDVTVDGSLLVHADNIIGHQDASLAYSSDGSNGSSNGSNGGYSSWRANPVNGGSGGSNGKGSGNDSKGSGSSAQLMYSCHNGRVHMMNVAVQNVGIDWHHPGNVYWQHKVQRHEACSIILRGRSEFEAYDCKIRGDQVRGLQVCELVRPDWLLLCLSLWSLLHLCHNALNAGRRPVPTL
jgi:hypothetical protein